MGIRVGKVVTTSNGFVGRNERVVVRKILGGITYMMIGFNVQYMS